MTVCTGRRELGRSMIRIVRLVVIIQMTTDTGIGSGIIISVMANYTIVGYSHMCASQNIVIIVDRESSRGPVRICSMAGRTLSRNTDCAMIRICCLVVIGLVASNACIGCIYVTTLMTGEAVVGNGRMCSCKRVNIVMVKYRGDPGILRMTRFTGSRELGSDMIRIGRLVELSCMAAIT
jgi:hypothetical protein